MKLTKRINPEVQRKLGEAFFVGKLASEDDLSPTMLDEPVSYQGESQDYIHFHIKCLSPIPEELSKLFYYPNKIFTGSTIISTNYNKLVEWMQFDRLHHFEIKDKVYNFLKDKLIIFQMICSNEYVNVELVKIENITPSESGYMIIPGPQLRLQESKRDFEEKLTGIRRPIILKYYPNFFFLPEYLYQQGTLYNVTLKPSLNPTTYTQQESNEVFYLDNFEDYMADITDTMIDDNLYFVQADKILDIRDKMNDSQNRLSERIESEQIKEQNKKAENLEENHATSFNSDEQKESLSYLSNKEENEFLKHLEENTRKKGLFFHDEDLYAFHISVKTNLLTIIGGMSGTGKSQLAQIYGQTMGLNFGMELLLIPVSPSYREPSDVLGYLNPTNGVYHESETGLVRLLLDAEDTPEKMYMVIFDEMNLSQVEHWFSPFISLLEVDQDKRYLTLFNENSYCVNNYKPKVKIGDNIIFVGTVNFDETTTDFSDRLLDRTNVIQPTKLTFKESLSIASKYQREDDTIISYNVNKTLFRRDWVVPEKKVLNGLLETEVEFLDKLHLLLNDGDSQKGVSFRAALGISRFLNNIPVDQEGKLIISREIAFDRQIEQRVLTKIKGFEAYAKPLVGNYTNGEYVDGTIMTLLQSEVGNKVSYFKRSIRALKRKAKELMLYGFAK
ncbi:hypothetical protein ACFP7A_13105 [Sporolactobacillus kofuensis]|uniref:ATPase dynein-related AAA domain-containing protein n=1 Tax=Sporolactobacillus kofuensis TaxID=269672 RepID=A0ABW1WH25_9BACL|nr:hypothetical protein [Sporolactobacillus kofuensis]MCO7176987.1 hypothetical protein [Sporolactobacillus kofuensis]